MSACLHCPMVVAASHLAIPSDVLAAEPALALLCVDHFKAFAVQKQRREARKIREANRMWCPCGREKYLDRPGPCSHCSLGVQPVAEVPCGTMSIRPDPDWYRAAVCDSSGCSAKMVYRLPDGRTVCADHGAGVASADTAGRS